MLEVDHVAGRLCTPGPVLQNWREGPRSGRVASGRRDSPCRGCGGGGGGSFGLFLVDSTGVVVSNSLIVSGKGGDGAAGGAGGAGDHAGFAGASGDGAVGVSRPPARRDSGRLRGRRRSARLADAVTRCPDTAVLAPRLGWALVVALVLALAVAPSALAVRVTVFTARVTQGSYPREITVGPDKKVWFQEAGGKVARVNPANGHVDEFSTGITPGTYLAGIAAASDGNIWVSESSRPGFARVTPSSGAIHELPAMAPGSSPEFVVGGPDGNLWFVDGDNIGRLNPHTGAIKEFPVTAGRGPEEITVGPDKNLWFTFGDTAGIGRVTTAGKVTEFPTTGLTPTTGLGGIKTGADHNLWFVERQDNAIGRITTAGKIREFSAGLAPSSEGPEGIARGADGNIWFGEGDKGVSLGRITPAGKISEFPNGMPAHTQPGDGFIGGPDGNVWFTVSQIETGGVDGVARMTLDLPPRVVTLAAAHVGRSKATLKGTVNPLGSRPTVRFEWGRTTAYGHLTLSHILPRSGRAIPIKAKITGLSPHTTYHYRVIATNAFGTRKGTDRKFKTAP
jgi:virginiamycin B lyase